MVKDVVFRHAGVCPSDSPSEIRLKPGQIVRYEDTPWQVWSFFPGGAICLMRVDGARAPLFKRVKESQLGHGNG